MVTMTRASKRMLFQKRNYYTLEQIKKAEFRYSIEDKFY